MGEWYYVVGADSFSYLTQSQKEHNALIIAETLRPLGWTDIAIAGALGSMSIEGIMNPGQGEVGYGLPANNFDTAYEGGLGLIQWTKPYGGDINGLLKYAQSKSKPWYDGDIQVELLDHCDDPDYTYYLWGWSTASQYAYPVTFQEYKQLSSSPSNAASIWFRNLERPADPTASESIRQQNAEHWYTYITTHSLYVPRLEVGDIYTSPYYTTWDAYYPTYGLPNCTCYVFGRWNELCDIRQYHTDFPTGMGYQWYDQGLAKGFTGGMIPQLGAAACWDYMGYDEGVYTHTGHVAVVEQINYDSNGNAVSFVTSNSAWYRGSDWQNPQNEFPWFYLNTIGMNNLNNPWNKDWCVFKGFLYNQNIIPSPPSPPSPTPSPTPSGKATKMPFVFYLKRNF